MSSTGNDAPFDAETLLHTPDWRTSLPLVPAAALRETLIPFLLRQRWFAGKARPVASIVLADLIPLPEDMALTLWDVEDDRQVRQRYIIPLSCHSGERLPSRRQNAVLENESGAIIEVAAEPAFWQVLTRILASQQEWRGKYGALLSRRYRDDSLKLLQRSPEVPRPQTRQQSHSSAILGDHSLLKLFRRTEAGVNPELEIGAALAGSSRPAPAPTLFGDVIYRDDRGQESALAVWQQLVPNDGDAWGMTLKMLQNILAGELPKGPLPKEPSLADYLGNANQTTDAADPAVGFLEESIRRAWLLGKRTGELHHAVAGLVENKDFVPVPLGPADRERMSQSMQQTVRDSLHLLRLKRASLPDTARPLVDAVLAATDRFEATFTRLEATEFHSSLFRVHGDYHLGQVLWTGEDFVIIDFEGEPERPLEERRRRSSPLRDVAGMLRSYDYARQACFDQWLKDHPDPSEERRDAVWVTLTHWKQQVWRAFLGGYREKVISEAWYPAAQDELALLLSACLTEKAAYELSYELNNRPDWTLIPLAALATYASG